MEETVHSQMSDSEQGKPKNELWDWIKALVIAFVCVLLIRTFVFIPTIVSGPSMLPNFEDRERLIVNKFIYYIKEPQRGEVIVFHAPEKKDYIKRVIALPGETVKVAGDEVYIDDQIINEPYLAEKLREAKESGIPYNRTDFKVTENGVASVTVPEDSLFVMGDNRSYSKDSRMASVGFIPMEKVVGRVDVVFWPPQDFKFVRHGKE